MTPLRKILLALFVMLSLYQGIPALGVPAYDQHKDDQKPKKKEPAGKPVVKDKRDSGGRKDPPPKDKKN